MLNYKAKRDVYYNSGTVVLLMIQVVRDVTICHCVGDSQRFDG
jgi:hypothetical protein